MIDAHRGAFEYDWRTRFHLPLRVVGRSMSWGEAFRLTVELSSDPSSAIAAAIAGWDHRASREALVLMDLFDLQHSSKVKRRPKPYQRPWADKSRRTFGRGIPRDELLAILDAHRTGDEHG